MKSSQNKDKVLTLRVSHTQYEKICALADIREMNVTEYIRHTAIGNRIKPTVIEQIKESSEVSELFTIRHSSAIFISWKMKSTN